MSGENVLKLLLGIARLLTELRTQVPIGQQPGFGFVPPRLQVVFISVPEIGVLFPGLSLGDGDAGFPRYGVNA